MGVRNWQRPTKIQSVFMAFLGLLMLFSAAFAVLVEGRPVTPLLILFVVIDLAWVTAAVWFYRRAPKDPPA